MEFRIVVHSLADMRAALAAAAETGVAVTLLSARGAAAYLGAAVFREMAAAAFAAHPEVEARAVLDCGNDAGQALNALRQGVKYLRIDLSGDVRRRVADIAAQVGAELDAGPEPGLDLADVADPPAACRAWLRSHTTKAPDHGLAPAGQRD